MHICQNYRAKREKYLRFFKILPSKPRLPRHHVHPLPAFIGRRRNACHLFIRFQTTNAR
jgi:hypothetical protein